MLFRAGTKQNWSSFTVCWHITAITFCRCLLLVLKLDFWSSSGCRATAQCQGRCLQKIWTKRLSCSNTRYVRGLTDWFLTFNARSVARVKLWWLHTLHQIGGFRHSIKLYRRLCKIKTKYVSKIQTHKRFKGTVISHDNPNHVRLVGVSLFVRNDNNQI